MQKYITVMQAAKKLNVALETIYNMCRDGRLGGRYSKGNGKKKGKWLIEEESIELFLKYTSFKSIYQLQENKNQGRLF